MKLNEIVEKLTRHSHACTCECCEGGPHYEHEGALPKGQPVIPKPSLDKIMVARLVVAVILFALGLLSHTLFKVEILEPIFMILAALIAGYDILIGAVVSIVKRKTFDENLLMAVAAIAAFIVGESHEGAAVMLLFQIGELFQDYAVGKTRQSVAELVNLRAETATVLDGEEARTVPVDEVAVGATIVIGPDEVVPLDCVVMDGSSVMDTSLLTGDGAPQSVREGDHLLSGYYNTGTAIKAEVTATASESTSARILQMVQAESTKRGKTEKFITKFARIYTPIVLALAVILAVVIPLVTELSLTESIQRALVFLVIACPCALVISVPLAYFAGIGGASRLGVLFKNSAAMDAIAKTKAVVFDKDGTLTTGGMRVTSVKSDRMEADMLLKIAAHAEAYAASPTSKAIMSAYDGNVYLELIDKFVEYPDGVTVTVNGILIALGTQSFLELRGIDLGEDAGVQNAVYLSIADQYAGRLVLSDAIREDSADAVRELEFAGGEHVAMLTGDSKEASDALAKAVGIDEYYADCLPMDKIAKVKDIKSRVGTKGTLIFVGDSISDIPAIDAADVGIAMGGLGSEAAIEAADVVIIDDKPTKVATAIYAARSTRRIVFQNVIFILFIKVLVLVLGAFGISPLWFAVFADVGVALAAVLNSMRAFYIRIPKDIIK